MNCKVKGEAFVKLPRNLLESAAWRSLSINARRLIDFLLIEHLRHGGRENGRLLAPRRQLERFGIASHLVSTAIEETERVGLVDCKRGVGRCPNIYGLTWLSRGDDPPTNRWRHHEETAAQLIANRKAAKARKKRPLMTVKPQSLQMTALCTQNDCQSAVTKPVVTNRVQSLQGAVKVQHLSRISYQGEAKDGRREGAGEQEPVLGGAVGESRPAEPGQALRMVGPVAAKQG
jgi:hypothetical protein